MYPSENNDEEREDVTARGSRGCEPSVWVTWAVNGWSGMHHRLGSTTGLLTHAHTYSMLLSA